jgi:hypothetical protein
MSVCGHEEAEVEEKRKRKSTEWARAARFKSYCHHNGC